MTGRRLYIREWRKYRRLKQEALAAAAGLARGTVARIENGTRSYTQNSLEAIARALQVPAGVLLLCRPDDTPKA